jgi:hypothetical protein
MPVPGFPGAPMEIKGSISRRYHIILSSPFKFCNPWIPSLWRNPCHPVPGIP